MISLDGWIRRQQVRLAIGRVVQQATPWVVGFLCAFGTVVLLVKRLRPDFWPHVLWLAAAVIPLVGIVGWMTRRQRFTRSEAAALLDRSLGANGLVMTLAERPDPRWSNRLPQDASTWREGLFPLRPLRTARTLAWPCLFVLGACCVPARIAETAPPPSAPVAGERATGQLLEMMQALEAAQALAPDDKQSWLSEIAKLADETRHAPLTHEKWEVVDALAEQMRMRLDAADMNVSKAQTALAALAALRSGDENRLSNLPTEQLADTALRTLEQLVETNAFQNAPVELQQGLERLAQSGILQDQVDSPQRQAQLNQLREFLESQHGKLAAARGQLPGEGRPGQPGQGHRESSFTSGQQSGSSPGQGKASAGAEAAALTFGRESDENVQKFKEVVLPPGFADDPRKETVGTTAAAPAVDVPESSTRAPLRTRRSATGRESWSRDVRPRHRQVVRDYFSSP